MYFAAVNVSVNCFIFLVNNIHERRDSVVDSTLVWHAGDQGSIPGHVMFRCNNLALNIRDCESLCLSDETLKAVGPFYLVSVPGEVKDPTQGVNV